MSMEAFAFRSHHTLRAMRALLERDASLAWRGGDNDHWGVYLVSRRSDGARFRLFVDKDRFVLDISCVDEGRELDAAVELARDKLLPLLSATDIEPHSGWE